MEKKLDQYSIDRLKLNNREFTLIRQLVLKNSGINLTDSKKELIKARLSKRLKELGYSTFKDYYRFVTSDDSSGNELINLINAISTNKTDFFREINHFDFLEKELLPELIEQKKRINSNKIRIWSAACSTGEEPYSLAITINNFFENILCWDIKILAVDISTDVLSKAMAGIYPKEKLRTIPYMGLNEHFTNIETHQKGHYAVKQHLRSLITFRRMDIINGNYPFHGRFDVIFCRNVMIYFDKATREKLILRFHKYLEPKGYLFIGHSESLHGMQTGFKYVKPTIYQKK